MSRGLKYTIPFASLNNTQYVANIYVEGFSGDATTMTAAAKPFYTAEQNDHQWLTVPVRTQTGYLRVVCEESEWRGLIPTSATSHYVELKKGNDIMWFGFIKPEAFTHSLYSGVDTYEFPIQCPLSVLDGMNLEWDASQSINSFATLLHRVISLSGVTFTNCYFPNNLENLFDDLLATSNTIQYYETAERLEAVLSGAATITDYYLKPRVTALEILKDICQFWGWECHQWGTELYFTAHDEHCGYRKIPFADLTTLTTSYNMQLTAAGYIGVEDAVYMTAKHQVEMALPAREVTVKTDINETSDIMDVDISAVAQFSDMPPGWTRVGDNIIANCLIFRTDYEYPGVQIPGMIVEYEGANGMDGATKASLEAKGILNQYGPVFQRISEFSATGANPNKYNLQDYIFMYGITENGDDAYAYLSLSTIASYSFYQCGIAISANVYCVIAHGVADPGLQAQISVGNYVWTGSIWEYHPDGWRGTWVNIPIGQNSSTAQTHDAVIVNTEIWDTPYQGAEGFVVPVTTPISGTLRIVFRWAQTQEQYCQSETIYPYMRMDSLGVKVYRPSSGSTISPKRENSREYKEDITTQSSESVSVDVKYATDNWNTFGTAFVCTKEGSYMKNMTYWTGDSERPEQHLLDRLTALYTKPTEWREIDVDDSLEKYSGTAFALLDENGDYWSPVAVARNWVDNVARMTIGKVGQWTPPTEYTLADCYNTIICDSSGNPFVVVGS